MAKRFKDMTEQEQVAYNRKRKIADDSKRLKDYEKRMRNTMKNEGQAFDAFAVNQRKSRELALGTCALKALDSVRELMRKKRLVPESLEFMISESPVQDENGKKAFHCRVMYKVTTFEPAYTEEEIRKEIEDTFEKMMRETDNLYPAEEEDETEKDSAQEEAHAKTAEG